MLRTSMDQPLGNTVGHALEVREAVAALRGEGPPDLEEVTVALVARLLVLTGVHPDQGSAAAAAAARAALRDGSALERFSRWLPLQGGDPSVVDDLDRLPSAPARASARAPRSGFVRRVDARAVGLLVRRLGGGRRKKGDAIDPAVGLELKCKLRDELSRGDELAVVHAATRDAAEDGARRLERAVEIADEPPPPVPLVQALLPA